MSTWQTKTLPQIIDDLDGDIEIKLPGADARLPRSVLAAISRSVGGVANEEYFELSWQFKQLFPQTCGWTALLRHGEMKKVYPKGPTAARFNIALSGNDGVPAGIGATLTRSDNLAFTLDAFVEIADGAATVGVTCVTPGAIGNTTPGTKLTFSAVLPGIQSTAIVGSIVATGFDAESREAFRGRVIERWQKPPQGGDANDYVLWAKEVAGCTRAWPFPLWVGPGTVGLTFVQDNNAGSIIPSDGDVATMQAYVDNLRPVGMSGLYVFKPTALPLNPTIHLVPDNAENRAAITANLNAMIAVEAVPGGMLLASGETVSGSFYRSHIEEAIETAPGIDDSLLSIPAATISVEPGQIVTLGAITWV